MTNEDLIDLIDHLCELPSETEWVEFKRGDAVTNDRLGMYISGLSNAACVANKESGYLLFGVEDGTHKVVASSFNFRAKKEGNEELEFWIRRLLAPSIYFSYHVCNYDENRNVEVFIIPAAKSQPTRFKNYEKIRIGSNLTDLKKYPNLNRIIYNSESDWSSSIVEGATIEDLDPLAIQKAREKYKEKSVGKAYFDEIDGWSDAKFLNKAKINIDDKLTNTSIILLGKSESAHYLLPAVAQITWKLDTEETAYDHFGIPLFLSVNKVLAQIRNVNYKFFPNTQLIATEVRKYDSESILEALNNCIAHQDYNLNSRIILTEKVNKLLFTNAGSFYEGNPEDYSIGNKTPFKYRNQWLVNAMVALNMIDTLGFGIHKMFQSQKKRYFPLPDYHLSRKNEVTLELYGHAIDENYSKLLIEKRDNLTLSEVILLDKVQKGRGETLNSESIKKLRKKKLIEGRKPYLYISQQLAFDTGQKAVYTKNKGLNKKFYLELIIQHIENHGFASRKEIDELLFDKFPSYMNEKQKKKKVHNLLQQLSGNLIKNIGSRTKSKWILIENKQRISKE